MGCSALRTLHGLNEIELSFNHRIERLMLMTATFAVKRRKYSVTQGEAVVYLNDVEIAAFADEYAIDGVHGDVLYPNGSGALQWGSTKPDETFILAVLFPCEIHKKHYPRDVERMELMIRQILQERRSGGGGNGQGKEQASV